MVTDYFSFLIFNLFFRLIHPASHFSTTTFPSPIDIQLFR